MIRLLTDHDRDARSGSASTKPVSIRAASAARSASTAPISGLAARLPAPEKTRENQAVGLPRGGRTTKIHVVADLIGRPIVRHLPPGNHADITAAPALLQRAGPFRRLIADRADTFRQTLHKAGAKPVIPGRSHRTKPIRHDRQRYRDRWRIEAASGRLKHARRVATR